LARSLQLVWSRVQLRPTEHSWLEADFAVKALWTWSKGYGSRAEWLLLRRNLDAELTYTLSNAPSDAQPRQLIEQSCQRYFIEQLNREAKTELGMDEFQAQFYRAWLHHLALTALWPVGLSLRPNSKGVEAMHAICNYSNNSNSKPCRPCRPPMSVIC
jgi:hypothetical protein